MFDLLSQAVCARMKNPRSGRADQGRPGVVGPVGRVRDGMAPPAALLCTTDFWASGARESPDRVKRIRGSLGADWMQIVPQKSGFLRRHRRYTGIANSNWLPRSARYEREGACDSGNFKSRE